MFASILALFNLYMFCGCYISALRRNISKQLMSVALKTSKWREKNSSIGPSPNTMQATSCCMRFGLTCMGILQTFKMRFSYEAVTVVSAPSFDPITVYCIVLVAIIACVFFQSNFPNSRYSIGIVFVVLLFSVSIVFVAKMQNTRQKLYTSRKL